MVAIRSVKLYTAGEVRRFPFDDQGTPLTYEALVQKVAQIYTTLNVIKLAWKDKDNDSVVITNDEELLEATKNASGDVLHLYLISDNNQQQGVISSPDAKPKENAPAVEAQPTDPTLHVNVTCDHCGGIVRGLRYKCLTCPDFDLCASCESQRCHDEHPMIRIVSPDDKSWRKAFYVNQWPCYGRFPCGDRRPTDVQQDAAAAADHKPSTTDKSEGENAERVLPLGELIASALQAFGLELPKHAPTDGQDAKPGDNKNEDNAAKIQQSLQQMLTMGFSNDDNWLANLLTQMNGDILAVLDLIKPRPNGNQN